jgi:hypothetical protein
MKSLSPQEISNMNAAMRGQLLAISPVIKKRLATLTTADGGQVRAKLLNVGILTRLWLVVTVPVTVGVATAVPSVMAPYNLLSRVRLTDYNGTDRVNLTGFQLFQANSRRKKRIYGANQGANAQVTTNPLVPTAVGAATNMRFVLEVPVALDVDNPVIQLRNLSGAIYSQTNVGEMYLTIDTNASEYINGNSDALYQGAGTTTIALGQISIEVTQEYLAPQAMADGKIPLPVQDLDTVYELAGAISTSDNIVNGQEKLISYPNFRSVLAFHAGVFNNSLMATGVLSNVRLIANGSTTVFEASEFLALIQQREMMNGSDLVAGAYVFDYTDRPINTALYGNIQLGLTPGIALTTPRIDYAFESLYRANAALPGFNQGN